MDLVETLSDVKYWSEVLFSTIPTHLSDLEVKVMDFEILRKVLFKGLEGYISSIQFTWIWNKFR